MNCRPNDLAVIVRGVPAENIGKVITVTELFPFIGINAWRYEGARLLGEYGGECFAVDDKALRPIRDQDGTDEILRIAGKPQSIESPNKVTV